MMMETAESAQERGMSETAAAHGEAVASATREKKARRRPDAVTEFCGVHRTQSGEYGAQIWDGLRRAHVWLGTFGTAEEAAGAFDAAAVKLRGVAQSNRNIPVAVAVQPSASVALVKAEEHGDGVDAVERSTDAMWERAKRKRTSEGDAAAGAKMPRFFEGLTKQVTERQEAIQQRFLEVVEKREKGGVIREEAWWLQEMARLAHEHAMAATHNAALLSYIQQFTGQCIPMPSIAALPVRFMPPPSSWTHAQPPMFYAAAAPPPPSSQPPVTVSTQPQNPPTRPPAAPEPRRSRQVRNTRQAAAQVPLPHTSPATSWRRETGEAAAGRRRGPRRRCTR
ncbi:hypothetical protein QYE76_020420 [Lolium multiflorum]|uniref:AP2/ERF domain-containing protein n=1 Tax=Lolium multiflorum TaxID=4521 RepID=A0AAD8R4S5_LOLMU|nr:hypothetical protein QYE76_020420 [Lolium multiflorum]